MPGLEPGHLGLQPSALPVELQSQTARGSPNLMSRPHSRHDHNTVASSHPGGSETPSGKTKQLLITESRNTTPPGREPEPHRSVTFPWPGITPQRSTRGATRDRDSNTQLNARDNHTRLAGASNNYQGQIKAGPQAPFAQGQRQPHSTGEGTEKSVRSGATGTLRSSFDLLPLR